MDYAWTCSCCGKQFNTLPLDFGFKGPDQWFAIPEAERESRGNLSDDFCAIDKDLFIRGCLEIPIIDSSDIFIWGVWTSISKESFDRIGELWAAPVIENEPPRFGWLCNNISAYPKSTMGLKTNLYIRAGGIRHLVKVEPTDHPLAIEQRDGISLKRIEEIAAKSHTRH